MKTVFLMLKRKKRAKGALVFALLLAPLVAWAAWMLALFFLDTFQGDGLIQHQYAFESRRQLAIQILSDGRQALPVFYIAGLLLWLEVHLLSRYSKWSGVLPAGMTGALTGFVIAAVFVEMSLGVILPSVISGLLISLFLAWALRPSRLQG
ncbi:MAG: hypothetical protein HZA69_08235 [Gammaproteobacteria bacterium]|nr:hypothetical protein [Gammaproteobacteria bacterium]